MATTLTVNHRQLLDLIVQHYNRREPLFIWGEPGIGKTYTVRDACRVLADKLGLDGVSDWPERRDNTFWQIDNRLSQMDPVDLRGIPQERDGALAWLPPDFLARLPQGGHGILFFDEFNLAPPLTQAGAYSLIGDRRSGDAVLPDGFAVIAAGNRTEDQAHTYPMAKPLQNRYAHVTLEPPSAEAWIEWGAKRGIDGRILGFIEQNPGYLHKIDQDPEVPAFPTERTWEQTSNMIVGVEDWQSVQLQASVCVGPPTAAQFAAFAKLVAEFDLDEILSDPAKAKLPTEIDRLWALCSGLSERYRGKKTKALLAKCIAVSGRLEAEFGVLLLKMVKRHAANGHKAAMAALLRETGLAEKYGKYLL